MGKAEETEGGEGREEGSVTRKAEGAEGGNSRGEPSAVSRGDRGREKGGRRVLPWGRQRRQEGGEGREEGSVMRKAEESEGGNSRGDRQKRGGCSQGEGEATRPELLLLLSVQQSVGGEGERQGGEGQWLGNDVLQLLHRDFAPGAGQRAPRWSSCSSQGRSRDRCFPGAPPASASSPSLPSARQQYGPSPLRAPPAQQVEAPAAAAAAVRALSQGPTTKREEAK